MTWGKWENVFFWRGIWVNWPWQCLNKCTLSLSTSNLLYVKKCVYMYYVIRVGSAKQRKNLLHFSGQYRVNLIDWGSRSSLSVILSVHPLQLILLFQTQRAASWPKRSYNQMLSSVTCANLQFRGQFRIRSCLSSAWETSSYNTGMPWRCEIDNWSHSISGRQHNKLVNLQCWTNPTQSIFKPAAGVVSALTLICNGIRVTIATDMMGRQKQNTEETPENRGERQV